jgi:aquaporin Z
VIAPGAVVMAMLYAPGPLSGLHINPVVTLAFTARRVFKAILGDPLHRVQLAGSICAAWTLQLMYGHVSSGGNYPIAKPGGEWRSLVMEVILTAIVVPVILNTATGYRRIGHNAALAVGANRRAARPLRQPHQRRLHEPGPDIVSLDFTGWWIYIVGPIRGAAIGVMLIGLVRGVPGKLERGAAEGDALPLEN